MYLTKLQNSILIFLGILLIPFFSFASDSVTDNFESYTSNLCSSHWVSSSSSANYLCAYSYVETYQSSKRVKFNYLGYGGTYGIKRDDLTYTNGIKNVSIKYMSNYNWNSSFWGNSPVRFYISNGAKSLFMYMRCYNGSTIDCRYTLNGSSGGCGTFLSSNCTANTTYTATMTKTGVYTYKMTVNNVDSQTITADFIPNSFYWYPMEYSNSSYVNYYDDFSMEVEPTVINATCGSDNGQILASAPTQFCSVGNLITPSFVETATGWSWQCSGINGGTSASCSATFGITANSGICGNDNGQTLTSAPTQFCSQGTLVYPTYITTATGWSWDCAGNGGGSISHCYANKDSSIFTYPISPTSEDCSSYSLPDKWFCEINNTFKSIFFPSAGKLEELNQKYNQIGQKAPFNYINAIKYQVENMTIQDGTITMSLMGNTGQINLSGWGEVSGTIKRITSLLFSLAFLFWGINYIKHFFK